MRNISISEEFKTKMPHFIGATIEADVINTLHDEVLWTQIKESQSELCQRYTTETIKQHPVIQATRKAYRTFGKDPSRYRPSSEALIRRTLQRKNLYAINTLVDIGNLISIQTGYSIGVFDADKIEGSSITLGIGKQGEPYHGIGHGMLNIENLPVYRDAKGGIGTPTSDNERTKISLDTTHTLIIINGYDGCLERITDAMSSLEENLKQYIQGKGIAHSFF